MQLSVFRSFPVEPASDPEFRSANPRRRLAMAMALAMTATATALLLSLSSGAWAQAARSATAVISASAAAAELDTLVKAARADGELTLHTATPDTQAKRIIDAFTAKYGVKVGMLRVAGASLRQRYVAEAEAGKFAADIMMTAGAAELFAEECVKKGWMESISEAAIPVMRSGEFPVRFNRGPSAVVQITPWLIGYNTDKVKGADVPKDWKDLLNPKFKGQIIIPDPRAAFAYLDIWAVIADTYGAGFMQQLRAQSPRLASAGAGGIQSLGAGEGSIMFPTTSANVMTVKAKGGPVDMIAPDKTTGVEMQVMLTHRSKTQRSAAARLFANYVMSVEGNKVFNDEPGGVTMHDPVGLPRQYEAPKLSAQKRSQELFAQIGVQ